MFSSPCNDKCQDPLSQLLSNTWCSTIEDSCGGVLDEKAAAGRRSTAHSHRVPELPLGTVLCAVGKLLPQCSLLQRSLSTSEHALWVIQTSGSVLALRLPAGWLWVSCLIRQVSQILSSNRVRILVGKVCGIRQLLDVIVISKYSLFPLSSLLGKENGSFLLPISFIQSHCSAVENPPLI